jgi:L-asparagine transporter-like permease
MNIDTNSASYGTGFTGTIFSMVAVVVSMLPELDTWFRILASISAIIAAWVSIYVMISKLKKDKDK